MRPGAGGFRASATEELGGAADLTKGAGTRLGTSVSQRRAADNMSPGTCAASNPGRTTNEGNLNLHRIRLAVMTWAGTQMEERGAVYASPTRDGPKAEGATALTPTTQLRTVGARPIVDTSPRESGGN